MKRVVLPMTSIEFVDALAEVMEVERTELATVDRALAKAGLRQIARGKRRPDITLTEGLQILVAWAGAKKLTLAVEELDRLRQFQIIDKEPGARVPENYLRLFGGARAEFEGRDFVEMVAIVARRLGAGEFEAKDVWLTLEKQGNVQIQLKSDHEHVYEDFFLFGKPRLFGPRRVRVKVEISGRVLKWIYDVTERA